jgi:3',5'-cyclic AMP phosphodiesterase CpdA
MEVMSRREEWQMCAKKAKKEFIWVMGNHDDNRAWQALGMPSEKYYYSIEKGGWKIIVLFDSVYNARTKGGIDEEQLAWLENELKTDKKVVIAQHHPLYDRYGDELVSGTNFDKLKKKFLSVMKMSNMFWQDILTRIIFVPTRARLIFVEYEH